MFSYVFMFHIKTTFTVNYVKLNGKMQKDETKKIDLNQKCLTKNIYPQWKEPDQVDMCLFQKHFSYTSFYNSQMHLIIAPATSYDTLNYSITFTIQLIIPSMPLTLHTYNIYVYRMFSQLHVRVTGIYFNELSKIWGLLNFE